MEGLSHPNERELARKAKDDDGAFAELYDFYFPKIWGFVMRRVGHKETAEDLVSTVFLKCVEAMPKWRGDAPFGAWLFRICANTVIDHYRTDKGKRHQEMEQAEAMPSGGKGPDEIAAERMEFAAVEKAMTKLPTRDQEVLTLKFFGGLSNLEIAEAFGIEPGNAGVQIHRALAKLKKTV